MLIWYKITWKLFILGIELFLVFICSNILPKWFLFPKNKQIFEYHKYRKTKPTHDDANDLDTLRNTQIFGSLKGSIL